jgi:hypothetical protein
MATLWRWFVIACVVAVLFYFGIIGMLANLLGVVLVFIGSVVMTAGNFLI